MLAARRRALHLRERARRPLDVDRSAHHAPSRANVQRILDAVMAAQAEAGAIHAPARRLRRRVHGLQDGGSVEGA
jgi:hypothetical protein